jgi:hypothetical protein
MGGGSGLKYAASTIIYLSKSKEKEGTEVVGNIVKAKTKIEMHKAIYAKAVEYPEVKGGIKAIFEIINKAKVDRHCKKSFLRNYKGTSPEALLATITKIVETGTELSKKSD